jgi:predicted acylesterase/phospholipase RssA
MVGAAPMPGNINIALCLSGGGFRATLFHLGVLKRLHELGLLTRVRLLSAVSGGAVTAALFHCNVNTTASYGEINRDNRDTILDLWERDGRPVSYDWQSFEAKLLQATRAGVLGPYFRSLGIWLSLGIWFLCVFGLFSLGLTWFFSLIGIMAFLIAAILYIGILPQSREYAQQRDADFKQNKKFYEVGEEAGESFFSSRLPPRFRAFLLPLSPSMMRMIKLDALFHHESMGMLHLAPWLCLGAVELNRGRAMVFSNRVLAPLGTAGTTALFEQRARSRTVSEGNSYYIGLLPIAEAVAASSAFPPFFHPITIRRRNGSLVGIFTDGGVVDNAALLAPIDMMIHLSQDRPRYKKQVNPWTGARIEPSSFEERISDIFIVNAGAPASETRLRWPRFPYRVLRRVVDIMGGHQEVNVIQKLWLMDRQTGPKYTRMALEGSGFPLEDGPADSDIPYYLARIRTHFDAFDPVETATLVYSGYSQADLAFGPKAEATKDLRSFREVSREVTGAETAGNMSRDEIVRHLRFSHLRLSGWRQIRRAVAKVLDWLRSMFRQPSATGA